MTEPPFKVATPRMPMNTLTDGPSPLYKMSTGVPGHRGRHCLASGSRLEAELQELGDGELASLESEVMTSSAELAGRAMSSAKQRGMVITSLLESGDRMTMSPSASGMDKNMDSGIGMDADSSIDNGMNSIMIIDLGMNLESGLSMGKLFSQDSTNRATSSLKAGGRAITSSLKLGGRAMASPKSGYG